MPIPTRYVVSSPISCPHGFNESIWSHIILIKAMAGTDKKRPEIPVSAPPIITPNMEIKALILNREATIRGIRMFTSIIWMP